LHTVEARLARCLLETSERGGSHELRVQQYSSICPDALNVCATRPAFGERMQTLVSEVARATATNLVAAPTERWMNYYGPPGTIPWISYSELLNPDSTTTARLSNRVVFVGTLFSVGFTGGKGTDDFATPYSSFTGRKSPGVEVNATVRDIVRDLLQFSRNANVEGRSIVQNQKLWRSRSVGLHSASDQAERPVAE
jgi:CHASE2 domain-containing sensor protein